VNQEVNTGKEGHQAKKENYKLNHKKRSHVNVILSGGGQGEEKDFKGKRGAFRGFLQTKVQRQMSSSSGKRNNCEGGGCTKGGTISVLEEDVSVPQKKKVIKREKRKE